MAINFRVAIRDFSRFRRKREEGRTPSVAPVVFNVLLNLSSFPRAINLPEDISHSTRVTRILPFVEVTTVAIARKDVRGTKERPVAGGGWGRGDWATPWSRLILFLTLFSPFASLLHGDVTMSSSRSEWRKTATLMAS